MKLKDVLIMVLIAVGFFAVGMLVSQQLHQNTNEVTSTEQNRYTMISHGESLIIFDQQTGEYWSKYADTTMGPTDWTKFSPLSSDAQ